MMQKIRENQQFIDAIYRRMGIEPLPAVYSIELDPEKREEEERVDREGMYDIAEENESEVQSEGGVEEVREASEASSESNHVSE